MLTLENFVRQIQPLEINGSITRVVGSTIYARDFPAPLGAEVEILREHSRKITAEVIGFHGNETLLMAFDHLAGVQADAHVRLKCASPSLRVGTRLLGRVINAHGEYLDSKPTVLLPDRVAFQSDCPSPLQRPRIERPLGTGVRVLDSLLTCGEGQRMGIFAGSGVGKSTLLGQMARYSSADVNVIILVGERGREVREFLERDLGEEGLQRSVVIVATGDEPAVLRLRAAYVGTTIAEYFRDQGKSVLLMMDSVTRFALAQREIGLAASEPPATRGYPPSVFSLLPKLLERSGRTSRGSITAFYTVLVEGDDFNEPISDAVRGILDGHILLNRNLAEKGHWPAIDVLGSISRSMSDVVNPEHRAAAERVKRMLSAHRQAEDLINIGAYQAGSNPQVDLAIQLRGPIRKFLTQPFDEHSRFENSSQELFRLLQMMDALIAPAQKSPPTA